VNPHDNLARVGEVHVFGIHGASTERSTILATMAIAGIFPTSLGEAQRAEKMHRRALSTCCATEVSKQSMHSDANRLALVIGNSSYPDADAPLAQNRQRRKRVGERPS
jgi:hypothetical protein